MKYTKALASREEALARCLFARQELRAASSDLHDVYRAYPAPVLGAAAVAGFLLAQVRFGSGFVAAGARIATGPVFDIVRRMLQV